MFAIVINPALFREYIKLQKILIFNNKISRDSGGQNGYAPVMFRMISHIMASAGLACLWLTVPVAAAVPPQTCYSAIEVEAEQGLRIHSELMVIALTCMKAPAGGPALYAKYNRFTEQHKRLIGDYEADMMRFYRKQARGKAEAQLHNLRTHLANNISQQAIQMSVDRFCSRYAGRIDQALKMDEQKLRRWARQSWETAPVSAAVCAASNK